VQWILLVSRLQSFNPVLGSTELSNGYAMIYDYLYHVPIDTDISTKVVAWLAHFRMFSER